MTEENKTTIEDLKDEIGGVIPKVQHSEIELGERQDGKCPEDCDCGKVIDFQTLARKQKEERKNKLLSTSFHSLHGRDSAEKLDMMFGMIRKLDEDIETSDTKMKSNGVMMEFVLNQLDPDGSKMREFTSKKYNLEEMKDGDIVKAGDFVNTTMIIKAGNKDHEFPRPEMIISPEEQIEMTPFMGTDLIGMRIGESKIDEKRHIGIKITRGRKRVNTTVKSAQVQEPANDNPGM